MRWPVPRLEELLDQSRSALKIGPFGSQLRKADLADRGVHIVGIENVLSGSFDDLGGRYVSQEKFEELKAFAVQPGDLLVTTMGTIGEARLVPNGIGPSIMDSHLLRIRVNESLCSPHYICWVLKGSSFTRRALHGKAHGAIMKGLNSSIVRSLPVPLPPISEQRRITEILEQAAALKEKRALAQDGLSPVLRGIIQRMSAATGLNATPIHDLVDIVGGGTPSTTNLDYWKGELPWVSPKDMRGFVLTDTVDHISTKALNESATALIPPHSVLVVFRSGILAHRAPVAITANEVSINQDMKALVPRPGLVKPYLLLGWLITHQNALLGCVKRGATVHSLDGSAFRRIRITLPPEGEQVRYDMMVKAWLDIQERSAAAASSMATLFHVLLHRAFSGDLTARWREAHMKELLQEMEIQARHLKGDSE